MVRFSQVFEGCVMIMIFFNFRACHTLRAINQVAKWSRAI